MSAHLRSVRWLACALLATVAAAAGAQQAPALQSPAVQPPTVTRNGRDIYAEFRAGLADPDCDGQSSARWRDLYAAAPRRMASTDSDVLPLFAYVVDALRAANLPTEFALIPFVESGYKPAARSAAGPAGLWQMIAVTARDHRVPMRPGYDGRLSPVDSTRAAVRYLKTLYGMFAGDWRLAVMAYNAGEYRVFDALRRSGQVARHADPAKLTSLSGISQAYVRKLHALSCLLDQADDRDAWLQALDRPVPVLQAVSLPPGTRDLDSWAASHGRDAELVERLNPAFSDGRVARAQRPLQVLAPASAPEAADASMAVAPMVATTGSTSVQPVVQPAAPAKAPPIVASTMATAPPRTHTVSRGESLWTIARRYKLQVADLLSRNALAPRAILRPGMVLRLDGDLGE
jgi:membrane-bound lytic murein transglycosylase D